MARNTYFVTSRMQWTCPTLSLLQFQVNSTVSDTQSAHLYIQGRPQGLLGFIFAILGIHALTELSVTRSEVRARSRSLLTDTNVITPLHQITMVGARYGWPIWLLVWAAIFLIGSLFVLTQSLTYFLVFFLLAVGCFVWAFLNKAIELTLSAGGSADLILSFQPSVIEGVTVTYENALHAAELIRALILHASVPVRSATEFQGFTMPVAPAPVAAEHYVVHSSVPQPVEQTPYQPEPYYPPPTNDEDTARQILEEVKRLVKERQIQEAVNQLQYLIQHYPHTSSVEVARKYLQQIMTAYRKN